MRACSQEDFHGDRVWETTYPANTSSHRCLFPDTYDVLDTLSDTLHIAAHLCLIIAQEEEYCYSEFIDEEMKFQRTLVTHLRSHS